MPNAVDPGACIGGFAAPGGPSDPQGAGVSPARRMLHAARFADALS